MALETSILPFRWGIGAISVLYFILFRPQRPLAFALLLGGWLLYSLLIHRCLSRDVRSETLRKLLPVCDGLFAVAAILIVTGPVISITPLFSFVFASIAMRLSLRQSIVLGSALLVLLAAGLYFVYGQEQLNGSYIAFAAFNLLIMLLVTRFARKADRYKIVWYDLNTMLHQFPCGVIVEDERGLYANQYLARSLTPQRSECSGLDVRERVCRLWEEVERVCMQASALSARNDLTELSVRFPDGMERTYLCRCMRVGLASGRTVRVATFIDTTREAHLRQHLQEQERLRLLGTLTTMAVHEVRNPLAAIRATAQLISLSPNKASAATQAARIVAMIDELDAFIDRLLDVARVPVDPADVCDPDALIQEVIDLMEPLAQRRGVTLQYESRSPDMAILGDPFALRQVLINLVQNGIEAVSRGGTISLRTEQEANKVYITVRDDGEGIPPDVAERIFDPFYTTKRKGTGLGLYISRQIVEGHEGEITFSTGPDGTTFRVMLPGTPREKVDPGSA